MDIFYDNYSTDYYNVQSFINNILKDYKKYNILTTSGSLTWAESLEDIKDNNKCNILTPRYMLYQLKNNKCNISTTIFNNVMRNSIVKNKK